MNPEDPRWSITWTDTRRLDLSIQAHGSGGAALLTSADIHLRAPRSTVAAALDTAGVGVEATTSVRDVSAFVDTGIEPRSVLGVSLLYGIETTPAAVADIRSIVVDLDIERGDEVVYHTEITITPEDP